jgi:hypothetical protein
MAQVPLRIAVGLSTAALLGALTACDEAPPRPAPGDPPGTEVTTTFAETHPESPSTTVRGSIRYEDRSRAELIALANENGIDLAGLASESGVTIDELTTAQIIEALRAVVTQSVGKGCPGCWVI